MLYDMRIDMEEINHRLSESLTERLTQRQDEMTKFFEVRLMTMQRIGVNGNAKPNGRKYQ